MGNSKGNFKEYERATKGEVNSWRGKHSTVRFMLLLLMFMESWGVLLGLICTDMASALLRKCSHNFVKLSLEFAELAVE